MKILSTICEVKDNEGGQLTLHEVKGENQFDTHEEALKRMHELLKKNPESSYTIIPEYRNS